MLSAEEFAAQFQESWRALWCVAVSVLHDKALAEDVLQESAIIGLRKRGEFTPGTAFTPWMSTIVRFVALNHGRKSSRRRGASVDPVVIDRVEGSVGPAGGVSEREMFDDKVRAALEALPEVARQCLLMRTLFGAPYSEIAARYQIPEGTAMSHVHRARRAMRERLEVTVADLGSRGGSRQGRRGAG